MGWSAKGENSGGQGVTPSRGFAMVGREDELVLVCGALASPPAVVLVDGEAGVGKSRLVFEAGRQLSHSGLRVLTGLCHRLREPLPFGPVLDALRLVGPWLPEPKQLASQAGALGVLLPDLAGRLPDAPAVPEDPRAARFQLVGAVRAILDALGPVVLVVEDVHWADEATRDLLLFLARDLPRRAGLLLTYRREDLPDRDAVLGSAYRRPVGTGGAEVHLGPLTRAEVDELAGKVLGSRGNPTLGRALFERSGGLPLVVEEDLITLTEPAHRARLLTTDGSTLASTGGEAAMLARAGVPRGLHEAVTARMHGLGPQATAIVQAAAVLAVPAARALLGAVASLGPVQTDEALIEVLDAMVLSEPAAARYGFRHALAQQAVYRAIPGPRREDLHQHAVKVLSAQSPPPLVQIAYHTRALGDTEVWLERAEQAADQAIALGDQGTAAVLLREILDQPNLQVELRTRAALALARFAVFSTESSASIATLRRILSDPHLPTKVRGEVRLTLGLLMTNNALDARGGYRAVERSVRELEGARPELLLRAMVALATGSETYAEGQQWMRRAEAAANDSPDQVARAAVRASSLTLMALHGDPAVWESVRDLPRSSKDPAVLRQVARALYNVGSSAFELGCDARVPDLLEEAMELSRQAGYLGLVAMGGDCMLALDLRAGRWSRLDERASALAAEFPEMATVVRGAEQLHGSLAAARGQWTRALEHLGRAADMVKNSDGTGLNDVLRIAADTARIYLSLDKPQAAYTAIAPPVERLRRTGRWARVDDVLAVAVQAALATGHEADARQLLSEAEHGLNGLDAPGATADLHLARGILQLHEGDSKSAADDFDRARIMYNAIGRPHQTARAIEHTAAAHQTQQPLLAADELTQAAEIYTRLGAPADAARCQRAQRQLGLTRPQPRGRRGYGTELSPRETEVARQLADGATNQDIAHALSLSPRTVEHHVTNVLKKLHTTRTQLQKSGFHVP
ncbi:DNA-binding NarL/FixJ family response regulator [Catenulispora sp. MAP5-51]|uniref:ATP-binding protein n=1 Tax=Catenulispora sp. MAP5-51 TaxID=3156298 RepID=UPI0035122D19